MPRRINDAIEVQKQTAPATPAAGLVRFYAKSDGKLYSLDETGLETDLTAAAAASDPLVTRMMFR